MANGKEAEAPFMGRTFWFAVFVVAYILGLCTAVIFVNVSETGEKYADMIIPFLLGSGFGAIVGAFFATSESSQTKNKTIEKLVDNQGPLLAADLPKPLIKPEEGSSKP